MAFNSYSQLRRRSCSPFITFFYLQSTNPLIATPFYIEIISKLFKKQHLFKGKALLLNYTIMSHNWQNCSGGGVSDCVSSTVQYLNHSCKASGHYNFQFKLHLLILLSQNVSAHKIENVTKILNTSCKIVYI